MGRPSTYSEEIADLICEAIAITPKGLEHICAADERFPAASCVYKWLHQHDAFEEKYLRARAKQAFLLFDECLSIADDTCNDTRMVGQDDGEREVVNTEWIQRSKLRVDTRMRMAGKLNPKRLGDKLDVTSGGEKLNWAAEAAAARARGAKADD